MTEPPHGEHPAHERPMDERPAGEPDDAPQRARAMRRLKLVAQYSTGFVYLVSRTGVTGEQVALSRDLAPLLDKMRAQTRLPLAAGFGISTPEQAGAVAKMADGVVVGSAIVRQIEKDPAGLEALARSLAERMKK